MQRLTKQPMQAIEELEKKMSEIYVGIRRSWVTDSDPTVTHCANISCKAGGSNVPPHTHWHNTHIRTVGPAERSHGHFNTHVRNTDDLKKYECGNASVDTSCSLCLRYFLRIFLQIPSCTIQYRLWSANQLCRNTPLPWLPTISNRPSCRKLSLHPSRSAWLLIFWVSKTIPVQTNKSTLIHIVIFLCPCG